MSAIREQLAAHPFFRRLSSGLLDEIEKHARPVDFSAGETLIEAGDPADLCFAITSGRVAVGVHIPGRGLKIIETLHSGDVLGWSWLLGKHRWTFDAVGTKAGTAVVVDAEPLRRLVVDDPAAAMPMVLGVADVMNDRLHSARSRLMNLYGEDDE